MNIIGGKTRMERQLPTSFKLQTAFFIDIIVHKICLIPILIKLTGLATLNIQNFLYYLSMAPVFAICMRGRCKHLCFLTAAQLHRNTDTST